MTVNQHSPDHYSMKVQPLQERTCGRTSGRSVGKTLCCLVVGGVLLTLLVWKRCFLLYSKGQA